MEAKTTDRQQARLRRTRNAVAELDRLGIKYERRNDGHHFIVSHGGRTANLWPQGDKWSVAGTTEIEFGFWRMVEYLKGEGE